MLTEKVGSYHHKNIFIIVTRQKKGTMKTIDKSVERKVNGIMKKIKKGWKKDPRLT